MFSPFSLRWIFLCLLMNGLIGSVLLREPSRIEAVHATGGSVHFRIVPGSTLHHHTVHRRYFTYTSQPGELVQDSIQVTNSGTTRGSVDLYAVDATTSQVSGVTFFSPDDPRHDVGAWITLSRQKITLNPGQSQDVPFRLQIPRKVRVGQHGGGILAADAADQAIASNSGGVHSVVHVHSQDILGVLVTLPGTMVEKLQVTGITYDRKDLSQRILIGLSNTGTQILHPFGTLCLREINGRFLQTIPMKLAAILPQTIINYPVLIHHNGLHSGKYHISISLRYEGGYRVNDEAYFVVLQAQAAMNQKIPKPGTDWDIPHVLSHNAPSRSHSAFFPALILWPSLAGLLSILLLMAYLIIWSRKWDGRQAKSRQRVQLNHQSSLKKRTRRKIFS